MPFYAGALTDEQINALVKYIRSFARDEHPQPKSQAASERGSVSAANNCALCHQKQADQAVALYSKSAHANSGFKCEACHGGDPNAADKAMAHAVKFVGKPSANETLAMCGSCHTTELRTFKTSLHFPDPASAPRMTCVECHGAHTVGSPSRNFSFALYCAGCHGLEYLRDLPREFHQALSLADEEKDLLSRLLSSGRKPSDELLARREQVRRSVAEIVHATDTRGGLEKIPQILKLGDEFKAMIERETK
jgi:cytochrome c553